MAKEGYKNHRPGSVAGAVHKVFDQHGKEAAKKKGESLGLEPHTVRSMISLWERKIFSRKNPSKKKASKRVSRDGKTTKRVARVTRGAKKASPAARVSRKAASPERVQRPAKKASAA